MADTPLQLRGSLRHALPLASWMAAQVAVLAASASGWRWWHGASGLPGEYALAIVAVTQVGLSALLAPRLLRQTSDALLVAAWAILILLAAATIEPRPQPILPPVLGWMLLWLIGLHLWMRSSMPAVALRATVLITFTAASAIVAYGGGAGWEQWWRGWQWWPLWAVVEASEAASEAASDTSSHFAPHAPLLLLLSGLLLITIDWAQRRRGKVSQATE